MRLYTGDCKTIEFENVAEFRNWMAKLQAFADRRENKNEPVSFETGNETMGKVIFIIK